LIAVISKPFIEYLNSVCGVKESNMVYLPQHAEEVYLSMDFEPEDSNCIDIMFVGNIGIAQDVDCIIKAVALINSNRKYKVHFIGNGSKLEYAKEIVMENGLCDKIIFHGRHPVDEMPKFYKSADVCLLTLTNDSFVGKTIPSKLQGYMAAGKIVLGAIDGAAQDIINESKCGLCVDSGDHEGLARIMTEIIENPEKYKEYGKNGREYFNNHFTKDIHINKLEVLLKTICHR